MGKCLGGRPWIGDREAECDAEPKLLICSATNTYFAQVATVISLPSAEDELTKRVAEVMSILQRAADITGITAARMYNPQVEEALRGYSDAEAFDRLLQLRQGLSAAAAKDPRIAEFELLANGRTVIGENRPDAKLHAETLNRDTWDPWRDIVCEGIAELVAVHRLREVSCLYGFTRF